VSTTDKRRVRVWFGTHPIATYTATEDQAEQYARLMAQRFAGLKITIDNAPSRLDPILPVRAWWDRDPMRNGPL
jgi:hypothetical protein